ncbi:MAG: mandelate racemase [Alphaproteobacteria bacterium]|nr:mandelate racemase [Alphaproteobacteria bacterium]
METPIGHHAVVRLETEDGIVGWGEAPAGETWGGAEMRYYGETPETVCHMIEVHLFPAIRELSPLRMANIHARMDKVVKGHPYAKAALDIALYDIAGKALGQPVCDLLGGDFRDSIEVTHSLGIMPVDRCIEEAKQAVAEGILTIKCKTGLDPDRDVELVRRLREEVSATVKIRVDANEAYPSVSEAVRVTRLQQEYGVFICEQPLMGAEMLARVAERIDIPVMADESAWTVHDIVELHRLRAAECFSCYVTKPGGLWRARQQGDMAQALRMSCDIGGSVELGIGNAANLHLGAALENAILPSVLPVSKPKGAAGPEIAGNYYLDDIIAEPFAYRDGRVYRPTGPGLGIEVDEDKIAEYAL